MEFIKRVCVYRGAINETHTTNCFINIFKVIHVVSTLCAFGYKCAFSGKHYSVLPHSIKTVQNIR